MGLEDRGSKRDPEVAARLASLALVVGLDAFPKPRIENIAQQAADKLAELRQVSGKGLLLMKPKGDVIANIYDNCLFLRTDIFPIVSAIMERTEKAIAFDKHDILGCYFLSVDEGGTGRVELGLDNGSDSFEGGILDSPENIQDAWDKGNIRERKALGKFSKLTKDKLLKRFEWFVADHCQ